MSVERAGPRREHSTTAREGGAVLPPWMDFLLSSDTERLLPRLCMLGPLFFEAEVAREHLQQEYKREEVSCLFRSEH
jgi:hypothetical protein